VCRRAGITEAQFHDLACFEASPAFSLQEKLVLRLTVALTRTPANVSDELFRDLRAEFSEPQLVEITTAIAWENYRARFNRTFGVLAEGFSEGSFCPLPEPAVSA
jgi:alkylhydroperoxidase family enzyme